jgi:hypothetical protein
MLRGRKMLGIVDGSTPKESFLDENEWINKDAISQSIIYLALNIKNLCKT